MTPRDDAVVPELSTRQRREFERNGFVLLHDVLDEATVRAAREVIWDQLPADRDDPSTWVRDERSTNEAREAPTTEPFEDLLEQAYPYAESLVGEGALAPLGEPPTVNCIHEDWTNETSGGPTISYPEERDDDWDDDLGTHLDGSAQGQGDGTVSYLPFSIGVTVYVDHVEPRGGGTLVWPGSHENVAGFFEDHSWDEFVDEANPAGVRDAPPFEVNGPPGTVMLWHHNLVHSAGPNLSDRIRMALIGRLSRTDIAEIGPAGLTDPWRHYDGVRAVGDDR
jgi:hypothetical protein